jgi:transcriptional adapter 2-alpha
MQANDKKRPREEKEFLHRLRPFARLQTSEEYEAFTADMLCKLLIKINKNVSHFTRADETLLRKRIQELQHYRRLGLQTAADIEKYDQDVIRRVSCHLLQQFLQH